MKLKKILSALFAMKITLLLMGCTTSTEKVIYVDTDAVKGGNGETWATEYKYLQDAVDSAQKDEEIWVAAGTYYPTMEIGGNGDRLKSFQIKNGVAIYGGFMGNETSRAQRDWQANETILSGDLNGDDIGFTNNGENSYHVVTGNGTDATAILDGFIITAGNADSNTWPDDGGGGMSTYQGSPTITNCTFSGNSAFADGGGMRNWGSSKPKIMNCTFRGNKSNQEGGGMMNGEGSSPTVTNCIFSDNSAGEDGGNSANLTGGAMYSVNSSSPTVANCTFSGNLATTAGGGICNINSNPTLTNCILWGDSAPTGQEIHNSESTPIVTYSDIAGGYTGTGNIDADPQFKDLDLRLASDSPCIDAGDNTAVPDGVTTGLDAKPRILNSIVDMGAYEFELKRGS